MKNKKLFTALGTLAVVGTGLVSLANAQSVTTTATNSTTTPQKHQFQNRHGGPRGPGHDNMRKVDEAIIAGDFTAFQAAASNTPFAAITQATFSQLQPEFVAKKAAEDKIQAILKSAGIQMPQKGPKKTTATTS